MQYKVEKEGGREKFSRETNKNQEYGMFTFVNKGTVCVCEYKRSEEITGKEEQCVERGFAKKSKELARVAGLLYREKVSDHLRVRLKR